MNTWNSIAWFPLCVGLTGVGLVLSWFAWRRKGARRGIQAVAWSLLPLALYLTGAIELVGKIGSAVVQFASSSPPGKPADPRPGDGPAPRRLRRPGRPACHGRMRSRRMRTMKHGHAWPCASAARRAA